MGMFDDVRVKYPLPNPEHQGMTFQTRDLACLLGKYEVTSDGRLVMLKRSCLDRDACQEDTNYHGDLHILGGGPEWPEYRLRFSEGTVTNVWAWGMAGWVHAPEVSGEAQHDPA